MQPEIALSKNRVIAALKKPPHALTRADLESFVISEGIEMVNFMYPAGDGRLKTLNFVVNDLAYLDTILRSGERVDGSSLFSSIKAGNSDLYVLPRYATAFVDPFAQRPTLCMLCSFFDKDGHPLATDPRNTLERACDLLQQQTALRLQAMGELEYYVITPEEDSFPAVDQHGYHESAPFAKTNEFRTECMALIAQTGGKIKYGHSEVGNFTQEGLVYEQNEIEFLPVDAPDAADQLMLAKWVIRTLAYKRGLNVTFAPKITTGKAGSGLHIHMRLVDQRGRNALLAPGGGLSHQAHGLIAGLMTLAPSLTAFGNTTPTSYFRLVPHQEAPTSVCWGDRNRSVLVRVPLGWTGTAADMGALANPQERGEQPLEALEMLDCPLGARFDPAQKQTIEIRSGDCSADIYLYLAGIAVAARLGLLMEQAEKIAADTYVPLGRTASDTPEAYEQLPDSCALSADRLLQQRALYEQDGVFNPALVDDTVSRLRAFADQGLRQRASADPRLMAHIVKNAFYCG